MYYYGPRSTKKKSDGVFVFQSKPLLKLFHASLSLSALRHSFSLSSHLSPLTSHLSPLTSHTHLSSLSHRVTLNILTRHHSNPPGVSKMEANATEALPMRDAPSAPPFLLYACNSNSVSARNKHPSGPPPSSIHHHTTLHVFSRPTDRPS